MEIFFLECFLGPAVDDVDVEEVGTKKENHAGASPWAAHVYQIACPDRWGGLYEGKKVSERLACWLSTGGAELLRLVGLKVVLPKFAVPLRTLPRPGKEISNRTRRS